MFLSKSKGFSLENTFFDKKCVKFASQTGLSSRKAKILFEKYLVVKVYNILFSEMAF